MRISPRTSRDTIPYRVHIFSLTEKCGQKYHKSPFDLDSVVTFLIIPSTSTTNENYSTRSQVGFRMNVIRVNQRVLGMSWIVNWK